MVTPSIFSALGYLSRFKDVARTNRFFAKINSRINSPLANLGTLELMMQCETAELPGKQMATFEAHTHGPSIKYPYLTQFGDLSLTFYCVSNRILGINSGLPEKRYFDKWMNSIQAVTPANGLQNSYKLAYKDDYVADIFVTAIDTDGTPMYTVRYNQAFPTSMNPIPVSWGGEDVMRLTMTFAFSTWETQDLGIAFAGLPI